MHRAIPILLLTVLLAATAAAAAPSLEVVREVGGDDDEVLLHDPSVLRFAPDGSSYLLCTGDCTVVHLSPEWEVINRFGRVGEGPGEFSNPTGMILHENRIWVFEMSRFVIFELDGTWVETRRTEAQIHSPIVVDGKIYARMGTGETIAAQIDEQGEVLMRTGFECPRNDFIEHFKSCGNVYLLPHDEALFIAVNVFSGRATVVAGPDGEDRTISLMGESGEVTAEEETEDSVSVSLTLSMGPGGRDADGRYWFPVYDGEEGDPLKLRIFDAGLKRIGETTLPEDVLTWNIHVSPRGELILVDGRNSVLHVCRVVEDAM